MSKQPTEFPRRHPECVHCDHTTVKEYKVHVEVTVRTEGESPGSDEIALAINEALPKEMGWPGHEEDWGIYSIIAE